MFYCQWRLHGVYVHCSHCTQVFLHSLGGRSAVSIYSFGIMPSNFARGTSNEYFDFLGYQQLDFFRTFVIKKTYMLTFISLSFKINIYDINLISI